MKCAWQAYLNLLPQWMRQDVDKWGKDTLQELRLRLGRPVALVTNGGVSFLNRQVSEADISYVVNAASSYSPWASGSISSGFITASGGHRVGVCGDVAIVDGRISTIKFVTSLCIRVARDYHGIASSLEDLNGSTLILGPPGSGKTTLLRDIIRQKGKTGSIAVVDERRELFPVVNNQFCFYPGNCTEVISGCSKPDGMQMLLRTMNPLWIAVDEITADVDSCAVVNCAWCGVEVLATAHGNDWQDFLRRPAYRCLVETQLFRNVIVMRKDKSWHLERMEE